MMLLNLDNAHYFAEDGVLAAPIGTMGTGLIARRDFAPGETLFDMPLSGDPRSAVLRWHDALGDCNDRGCTFLPEFTFCPSPEHPFWSLNHSCGGNCGFVRWGAVHESVIPVVALRSIRAGEHVAADYSLITAEFDGTIDRGPWVMTDCQCGEPACRRTISGLSSMPLVMQRQAALNGHIIAHILHENQPLELWLRDNHPRQYEQYAAVLADHLQLQYVFGTRGA